MLRWRAWSRAIHRRKHWRCREILWPDMLRWISVSVSSHPLMVTVEEGKMSGTATGDGASAGTGEPGRPQHDPGYEPGDGKKRGPSRGIMITIIGALVTAGIATAA